MYQFTTTTTDGIKTICQCCGKGFVPNKGMHYIARDPDEGRTTIFAVSPEPKQHDAFDCPNCGCQIIVGERLRVIDKTTDDFGETDGEEVTDDAGMGNENCDCSTESEEFDG